MCAAHSAVKDATGQTFGRLTVVARAGSTPEGQATWWCQCLCGNVLSVMGKRLRSGNTTSCGCAQKDAFARSKEGYWRDKMLRVSAEHRKARTAWYGMIQRCTVPAHKSYHHYGGRGITVCPEWLDFDRFLADMGAPPPGMTLERVDNNAGYSLANCRWATIAEQTRNKRTNVYVEFRGERLTVQDWARRLGTQHTVIRRRIKLWGVELALTTPVTKRKPLTYRKGTVVPTHPAS